MKQELLCRTGFLKTPHTLSTRERNLVNCPQYLYVQCVVNVCILYVMGSVIIHALNDEPLVAMVVMKFLE